MGGRQGSGGAGSAAMAGMREQFEGAGLGVPPVPAALRSALRRPEDWAYATRDMSSLEMYLFRGFPSLVGPDSVEAVEAQGQVGRRLLVAESDLRSMSLCAWLDRRTVEVTTAHESRSGEPDALAVAMELLREYPSQFA